MRSRSPTRSRSAKATWRCRRSRPGQLPLVIGAGAIGLSAVAALASRGIEPIIVADFNDDRLALAREFGAHVTVNPSQRSPYDVLAEITAERGAAAPPCIFECVGAAGLLQQIVDACPMGSKIFAAGGWYTGRFAERHGVRRRSSS